MTLLNRDQILQVKDLKFDEIECPEWGGSVRIRSMTGVERDAFEQAIVGSDKKANFNNIRAKLVAMVSVDAEGKRLFTDADLKALGEKNAAPLNRLFTAAQRLSGLTEADVEAAAKN